MTERGTTARRREQRKGNTMDNWCDCCDEAQADWQTEQRTQVGAFTTRLFTQRLCLGCLEDKWQSVGKRELWGMRYRRLGTNAMWNQKGDIW